jgi:hypothetical protein
MKHSVTRKSVALPVGIAVWFIFLALTLGIATSVLPSGFMVRLSVLFFAILSLFFAWAFRSSRNSFPKGPLFLLLIFIISTSILWPRYIFFHIAGLPSVNLFTLSAMGGLYAIGILLVASPALSYRTAAVFKAGGLVSAAAISWILWRYFSSALGTEPIYSLFSLTRELIYVGSFFLFGLVFASLDESRTWLIRTIVACGLLVGVAGIVEAFASHNYFVQFANAGPDGDLSGSLAGIAAEKIRFGAFRAQSTFDHPIVFAQFVAALIPLALYCVGRDTSKFWRLVALVALPIAVIALLKAGSRAGFGSVIAGSAMIATIFWLRTIAHGKFSKAAAIVALPALIGALAIGYFVVQELALGRVQHEVSSSAVRLLMLKYGIAALTDSPLWGFGQGLALSKAGVVNIAGLATIDNYLLTIALDSGYVGLALFLLTLALFSWKALTYAVREKGPDGLFVGACLASVLAMAVTFSVLSILNNMTLLWLLMAATFPFLGRTTTITEKSQGK